MMNFVLIYHYWEGLQMNLAVRANLSSQEIDGELVILDKENGQIHQLNPVASFIWQQLELGLNDTVIVEKLVQFYDIEKTAARVDLDTILKQFTDLKLINI